MVGMDKQTKGTAIGKLHDTGDILYTVKNKQEHSIASRNKKQIYG